MFDIIPILAAAVLGVWGVYAPAIHTSSPYYLETPPQVYAMGPAQAQAQDVAYVKQKLAQWDSKLAPYRGHIHDKLFPEFANQPYKRSVLAIVLKMDERLRQWVDDCESGIESGWMRHGDIPTRVRMICEWVDSALARLDSLPNYPRFTPDNTVLTSASVRVEHGVVLVDDKPFVGLGFVTHPMPLVDADYHAAMGMRLASGGHLRWADQIEARNWAAYLKLGYMPLAGLGEHMRSDPELAAATGSHYYALDFSHPKAATYTRADAESVCDSLTDSVFTLDLANEFVYRPNTESDRTAFIRFLRGKHGGIQALNTVWNTNYPSFDEIGFPTYWQHGRDAQTIPPNANIGHFYDYCSFGDQLNADILKRFSDEIRKCAPGLLQQVKITTLSMLTRTGGPDDFLYALDYEKIEPFVDILGHDGGANGDILRWADYRTYLSYLHNLNPDKPIANTEWHLTDGPPMSAAQARAYILSGLLRGIRLGSFWVWQNDQESHNEWGGQVGWLTQPWLLEGISHANLDAQRLAADISRFPMQSDVAVVTSRESTFLSPGETMDVGWRTNHINTIFRITRSLVWNQIPYDVVTDTSLQDNAVRARYKALILPHLEYVTARTRAALASAAEDGCAVIAVGDCCKFTPYGQALEPMPFSRQFDLCKPVQLASHMKQLAQDGEVLSEVVIASGIGGRPCGGVEVQSVGDKEDMLISVVNMESVGKTIRLTRNGRPVQGRFDELLSGKNTSIHGGTIYVPPFTVWILSSKSYNLPNPTKLSTHDSAKLAYGSLPNQFRDLPSLADFSNPTVRAVYADYANHTDDLYDESSYLSGSDVPQWKYPGGLAVGDSRLASYIIHYPTDTDSEDIVYALVDADSRQYYLRREMLKRQADSITVGPYKLQE